MAEKPKKVGEFTSAYRWTKMDPAWIPEISETMKASAEKLKAEFKIQEKALADGYANVPPTTDKELNATQLQVRDRAVQKTAMLFEFLTDQLGLAVQNLTGLNRRLDFSGAAKTAEGEFKRALAGDSRLKSASDKLAGAEQGQRYFVARHELRRAPNYKESPWLFAAIVIGLLVLESFLNGFILKEVSEGGWTGGVGLAAGISAVNIGLGLVGGAVGWRLLGNRFPFPKTLGVIFTSVTLAAAVVWNIYIAHYRQLAEDEIARMQQEAAVLDPLALNPAELATADPGALAAATPQASSDSLFTGAWQHMNSQGWFALDSIWAWLLLGVGLLIFLFACREGWDDMADRYWDYRKFDLKRRKTEQAFEDECEFAVKTAAGKLDDAVAAARAEVKSVEDGKQRSEAIADLAEQRVAEVLNSEANWINECNQLLRYYREENLRVRDPAIGVPVYWESYPTPEDYRRFLGQAAGEAGNIRLGEEQIRTVRQRRAELDEIIAANRQALEKLETEVLNLRASVPEMAKELRAAAKNRSWEDLMKRLADGAPAAPNAPRKSAESAFAGAD